MFQIQGYCCISVQHFPIDICFYFIIDAHTLMCLVARGWKHQRKLIGGGLEYVEGVRKNALKSKTILLRSTVHKSGVYGCM